MFFLFSMPRDIGARQGQVHWKVRWVDQPDFGHYLILFSEGSICICSKYIYE